VAPRAIRGAYPPSGIHAGEDVYQKKVKHYIQIAEENEIEKECQKEDYLEAMKKQERRRKLYRMKKERREMAGLKQVEDSFSRLMESSGERKELDSNLAEIQAKAAERKKQIESNLVLLNQACAALPGPEELAAMKRRVSARTVQGGIRGRNARRDKVSMLDTEASRIQAAIKGRKSRQISTPGVIAASDVATAIAHGLAGDVVSQNRLLSHLEGGVSHISPIQIQPKQTMSRTR